MNINVRDSKELNPKDEIYKNIKIAKKELWIIDRKSMFTPGIVGCAW